MSSTPRRLRRSIVPVLGVLALAAGLSACQVSQETVNGDPYGQASFTKDCPPAKVQVSANTINATEATNIVIGIDHQVAFRKDDVAPGGSGVVVTFPVDATHADVYMWPTDGTGPSSYMEVDMPDCGT